MSTLETDLEIILTKINEYSKLTLKTKNTILRYSYIEIIEKYAKDFQKLVDMERGL